jgi:hypothetical protein
LNTEHSSSVTQHDKERLELEVYIRELENKNQRLDKLNRILVRNQKIGLAAKAMK